MGAEFRVELFECLVEQAAEMTGVHRHLDMCLEETRELHKTLKDEEAALRGQKKQGKLQALERLKKQVLHRLWFGV